MTVFMVDDANQCAQVLENAVAVPGPVLVEAAVDPHEPPGHSPVSCDQATHLGDALLKGNPTAKKSP